MEVVQVLVLLHTSQGSDHRGLLVGDDALRDVPHLLEEHLPEELEVLDLFIFYEAHTKDAGRKGFHETREDAEPPRLVLGAPSLADCVGDIKPDAVVEPLVLLEHRRTDEEEDIRERLFFFIPLLVCNLPSLLLQLPGKSSDSLIVTF